MIKLKTFILFVFTLLFFAHANALLIRVSQESAAGVGDFDANVLGSIEAYSTPLSIADFYQYNVPNGASYNGELNGGPNPISSLAQNFFVMASDGLNLVTVYDNPNDGSGGSVRMSWNLSGDTAAFTVGDDPGEGIMVSDGGTRFDTVHNWLACCTDGFSIGSLEGDWTMLGAFDMLPTGITDWAATSYDSSLISLTMAPNQRVRFDVELVSEPAILALFGIGLIAIALVRRKSHS